MSIWVLSIGHLSTVVIGYEIGPIAYFSDQIGAIAYFSDEIGTIAYFSDHNSFKYSDWT